MDKEFIGTIIISVIIAIIILLLLYSNNLSVCAMEFNLTDNIRNCAMNRVGFL